MQSRRLRLLACVAAGYLSWTGFVQAADAGPGGLRLETSQRKSPLLLAAWNERGTQWVSLKAAVNFLGGSADWQVLAQSVKIQGPSGHQAVLTLEMPRMVVDKQKLIRLPHRAWMRRGQVVISPETLQVIWSQVDDRTPWYDSQKRIFRVTGDPLPIAQAANQAASAAPPAQPASADGRLVVLDAGHGGKDSGAIGPSRLQEKTVTLEVALQAADRLQRLGFKVLLTRSGDVFIPLPRRAEIANQAKADLFVSIHANASRNPGADGSQIFIYNREASSRKAAEVARLENQDTNYLEMIKDDLRQAVHESASITAAGLTSQRIGKIDRLQIRRIERAPFYVLAKSHMPSMLVETAFISNREEEERLRSREFCGRLADSIVQGVVSYFEELRRTKPGQPADPAGAKRQS